MANKERNKFIEQEGKLYYESDTHEWFTNDISTRYARKNSLNTQGDDNNDGLNVICFNVRDKQTGDYERVVMDVETNQPIYSTLSLEELAFFIDKLKIAKRFQYGK